MFNLGNKSPPVKIWYNYIHMSDDQHLCLTIVKIHDNPLEDTWRQFSVDFVSLVHAVTYEILLVQAYFRSTPRLNLIDLNYKVGTQNGPTVYKKTAQRFLQGNLTILWAIGELWLIHQCQGRCPRRPLERPSWMVLYVSRPPYLQLIQKHIITLSPEWIILHLLI